MSPKTLVTGGAGFIGSHLVDALIRNGHGVWVVDDLSGGFIENVNDQAHFYRMSVTDDTGLRTLFDQERFDYVYHLAAYAAEGLSHFIRQFNYTNNLVGTTNVVNNCVDFSVKHLVFTSSIAVYGDAHANDWGALEEDSPFIPMDPYGVAKLACEHDIMAADDYFGLDYTIFRPHNVFGPRQNIGDRYRNVIGIFMNKILQGQSIPVIGDGLQRRQFTYIDNILPAMVAALTVPQMNKQVFNLGSDYGYNILDLANMVIEAMGEDTAKVEFVGERRESSSPMVDHTRLHRLSKQIGFMPSQHVSIAEGLARMAEWVKVHGARKSTTFENIELKNRMLPQVWRQPNAS